MLFNSVDNFETCGKIVLDFVYFLYFATIFVASIVPSIKSRHATPLMRSDINVNSPLL